MRRLVAAQRELHGGETSQSDWSEDDEGREEAETDDGGLDHLSMAANGGLTDAEGAMSGMKTYKLKSLKVIKSKDCKCYVGGKDG